MKISKVNNKRAGISENLAGESGMLYDHPGQGKEPNLKDYIEKRNRDAGRLYNLFIAPENDKDYGRVCQTLNRYFSINVIERLSDHGGKDEIVKRLAQGITFDKPISVDKKSKEGKSIRITGSSLANKVVDTYLRQSLRKDIVIGEEKIYVPDAIKAIIVAGCEKSSADIKDIKAVVQMIEKDYFKKEQLAGIEKSIENQTVSVQIDQETDRLVLASYLNPKKQYIFNFLKAYSAADETSQKSMLRHMRYLILLYFYGEKVADEAAEGDLCEWSFGMTLGEHETVYSEDAYQEMLSYAEMTRKTDKRTCQDRIRQILEKANAAHYQQAVKKTSLSENDKGWITYISNQTLKYLLEKNAQADRLSCPHLCQHIWKNWVSYIALKYIDMGKAAYWFTMEDMQNISNGTEVEFGRIDDKYRNGISSFDYERISAEGGLNRSLNQFISFAINNFDNSVRPNSERTANKEDILAPNIGPTSDNYKKRLLRYFGGISSFAGTPIDQADGMELFNEMKTLLRSIRNENFHFAGSEESVNHEFVHAIFEKELATAGNVYRKKFYSNNVVKFHAVADINHFMDELYAVQLVEVAQIPAYNKILSRTKFPEFMEKFVPVDARKKLSDPAIAEMHRNMLYFVLKEIYYYDFLRKDDLTGRFMQALKDMTNNDRDVKNKKAMEDFKPRVKKLAYAGFTFGEICQEIMTEYNQQNNQRKKMPSGKQSKDREGNIIVEAIEDKGQIYKHYRTLLYRGINLAFLNFLNENKKYNFLKKPEYRENVQTEEEFVGGWKTKMYDALNIGNADNTFVSSWYIAAHFLNQKQLNHLIGQIKTYLQYITDINRRAAITGNRADDSVTAKTAKYKVLLDALDFVKLYCGQVSNNILDYFEDNDEYAEYVAQFVNYAGENGMNNAAYLQAFCDELVKKVGNGIYYDGMNPIPNRNIVLASMYGDAQVLSKVVKHVDEKDIKDNEKKRIKLEKVIKNGTCENKKDLEELRRFQNAKNRIELTDVLMMTELTNDLIAQLINYSYMRERDMMYFQLGFYYTKLFHTDSVSEDSLLRRIEGDGNITDGAVLYQIASIYSYALPIYDAKGKAMCNQQISKKMGIFIKYCQDHGEIYKNGLCFFEDISSKGNAGNEDGRHEEYVNLRNYIDHFKYFADQKYSILELYSQVYNGFFSYSTKLKKSIADVLSNILMSYAFVISLDYKGVKVNKNNQVYNAVNIECKTLVTDYYTFKTSDVKKAESEVQATQMDSADVAAFLKMRMSGGHSTKNEKATSWKKETKTNNVSNSSGSEEILVAARSNIMLENVRKLLSFKAGMDE